MTFDSKYVKKEKRKLKKIVFKEAPDWVKYAAMDDNGVWNWFSVKPKLDEFNNCWWCCISATSIPVPEWEKVKTDLDYIRTRVKRSK